MTETQAIDWLRELAKAVQNEHINVMQAHDEVFSEMQDGEHDLATETLFFNFTRSDTSEYA